MAKRARAPRAVLDTEVTEKAQRRRFTADTLGSRALTFKPGSPRAGDYRFSVTNIKVIESFLSVTITHAQQDRDTWIIELSRR